MMYGVSTSETVVSIYETSRRNTPEDSHFHSRRREKLKSHFLVSRLFINQTATSKRNSVK
jgi:hypothetical protein